MKRQHFSGGCSCFARNTHVGRIKRSATTPIIEAVSMHKTGRARAPCAMQTAGHQNLTAKNWDFMRKLCRQTPPQIHSHSHAFSREKGKRDSLKESRPPFTDIAAVLCLCVQYMQKERERERESERGFLYVVCQNGIRRQSRNRDVGSFSSRMSRVR